METSSVFDSRLSHSEHWLKLDACYSRTFSDFTMVPHFHNRVEVMYVLQGEARVCIYQHKKRENFSAVTITGKTEEVLKPGDFLIVDQGMLHDLTVVGENYMLNAEFSIVMVDGGLLSLESLAKASPEIQELKKIKKPVIKGHDEDKRVLPVLEQVVREFSVSGKESTVLSDLLAAQLCLQTACCIRGGSKRNRERGYVQKAKTYIYENIASDLRIDDIASAVCIASGYLQRIFKQETGQTLVQYIQSKRIEQSVQMLTLTKCSIMDVAVACGFNSRQHFFRVFKENIGVSPKEFRETNGKNGEMEYCHFGKSEEDFSYLIFQDENVADDRTVIAERAEHL